MEDGRKRKGDEGKMEEREFNKNSNLTVQNFTMGEVKRKRKTERERCNVLPHVQRCQMACHVSHGLATVSAPNLDTHVQFRRG